MRDILYDLPDRPRVLGRRDETGAPLLHAGAELSADEIARALARRLPQTEALRARRDFLDARAADLARTEVAAVRKPYFCSGCPHNTSTKVIDGSRAMAGIGCHFMARWMDRSTEFYSHMGGEGAAWIGQAPFTEEKHVFANIGDGTYYHSGIMAIRAAVASGVNITYKLLFNDAVAMTGGQPVDGPLTVPQITRQLAAEGVVRIAVVTDEPEKHAQRHRLRARRHACIIAATCRRWSARSATRRAAPPSSMTRPAPRRSGGGASAAPIPIRRSAPSSTPRCARAAATARTPRTASPWCRWRPRSAPSGRSNSRAATRISPASRDSARASSPSTAAACAAARA